jgi:hypothetical protein
VAVQNDAKVILPIQLIVLHARPSVVRLVHHNLEAVVVVFAAVSRRASIRLNQRRPARRQDRSCLIFRGRRRGVALSHHVQLRRA